MKLQCKKVFNWESHHKHIQAPAWHCTLAPVQPKPCLALRPEAACIVSPQGNGQHSFDTDMMMACECYWL